MANLFSGLENVGLKIDKDVELYEKNEDDGRGDSDESALGGAGGINDRKKAGIKEANMLFDKTFSCPVCDSDFKSKMVRTGKARLVSTDSDFRPRYLGIDPIKYDAILCPKCGYASLNRYFNFVMGYQSKLIREKISGSYVHKDFGDEIYTYDEAILRHKLALLNTIVKKGKLSEKAYTCLKLAWLTRGKREEVEAGGKADKSEIETLNEEEKNFLKNALDGFVNAYTKEQFPLCGMEPDAFMLLVSELAFRIGDYSTANIWTGKLLVEKNASKRIKNKASDLIIRIRELDNSVNEDEDKQ